MINMRQNYDRIVAHATWQGKIAAIAILIVGVYFCYHTFILGQAILVWEKVAAVTFLFTFPLIVILLLRDTFVDENGIGYIWRLSGGVRTIWEKQGRVINWSSIESVRITSDPILKNEPRARMNVDFKGISEGKAIRIGLGPGLKHYREALLFALDHIPASHVSEEVQQLAVRLSSTAVGHK